MSTPAGSLDDLAEPERLAARLRRALREQDADVLEASEPAAVVQRSRRRRPGSRW